MTQSASFGDLARAQFLRAANTATRQKLSDATAEVVSGQHADVAAAHRGQTGQIALIDATLTRISAYQRNGAQVTATLSAVDLALGAIHTLVWRKDVEITSQIAQGDDQGLRQSATLGQGDLDAVLSQLATTSGGRYVFAGTAVSNVPVLSSTAILTRIRDTIAAEPGKTPQAAVDDLFSATDGAGAYLGGCVVSGVAVADGRSTGNPAIAADPGLTAMLKGLTLAALAGDPDMTAAERRVVMGDAARNMATGTAGITTLRARVGAEAAGVEGAMTSNDTMTANLTMARNNLVSVDPYEAATALTEAEARMNKLYALTARLSRLSLTDYL
ncbi:MAG: hypothetical protein DI498_01455 [Paracoccus denitrificans]|nr:MAG: hypothetical protein DI498_01455 [Paracoccus denitrificans]PZO85833.1 MAG: hypothetical protein DI633_01455 [Paracoccus denitrificans]